MTPAQRKQALGALGDGMSLRETADICRVPWKQFTSYWVSGERDRQVGRDSEQAQWLTEALHARAKFRAELKLKANAAAGKRAATDHLRLLERLDAEELPGAASGAEIVTAPRIYVETTDPIVRKLAKDAMDASTALLEALAVA